MSARWKCNIAADNSARVRRSLESLSHKCAARASAASEPREWSEPAERRARERVGESEGQSPSGGIAPISYMRGASERRERATRMERAGGAASERACRGVRGAKPLGRNSTYLIHARRERAPRASHANGASRRSGERESVSGSPRGEAPRLRLDRCDPTCRGRTGELHVLCA